MGVEDLQTEVEVVLWFKHRGRVHHPKIFKLVSHWFSSRRSSLNLYAHVNRYIEKIGNRALKYNQPGLIVVVSSTSLFAEINYVQTTWRTTSWASDFFLVGFVWMKIEMWGALGLVEICSSRYGVLTLACHRRRCWNNCFWFQSESNSRCGWGTFGLDNGHHIH